MLNRRAFLYAVLTEATTLPSQDSVGRHDDQGLPDYWRGTGGLRS
jgi:hypothetical protein